MPETATVKTPDGTLTLHVCKDGDESNTDWVAIYQESFPPEQRQPVEELKQQLKSGQLELDETRDQNWRILCMTVSEIFRPTGSQPSFVLACYTAVTPSMRGLGIGSVHRTTMERLLKDEYGSYLGVFGEIESTKQKTDDPLLAQTRIRRKNFFLKCGLIPLNVPYRFPSYDGTEPLEGELLWFPFGRDTLTSSELESIVLRIYTEGYALSADDAFVQNEMETIRQALCDAERV